MSFLKGRKQYVSIESSEQKEPLISHIKSNTRGTPQGSSLSPILFIIYTVDLSRELNSCKIHQYADDTQVYLHFDPKNTNISVNFINNDLEHISQWSEKNNLVLNANKSKYMVLGSKHQRECIKGHNLQIKIGNESLEQVKVAKNLGLYVDENLRFIEHLNLKIKNAFYKLKVLYSLRPFMSEKVRVTLVESLILSIFNYCDTVYGPRLLKKTEKAIQRVQNACTRFCFDVPKRSHVAPFINCHNILNMKSRRKLHLAVSLHKIVRSKKPNYLYQKLDWLENRKDRSVRENEKIKLLIPKHKTVGFKGSFKYAAAKIWNNLPPPLRECHFSIVILKKCLKEYYLRLQVEVAT